LAAHVALDPPDLRARAEEDGHADGQEYRPFGEEGETSASVVEKACEEKQQT